MFKHVLFDLDGTLTRSHVGILRSVEYALNREGESTVDRLRQEVVIGPPLMYTFTHTYGFSTDKARRLYDYFQERYGTVGLFENEPYAGIVDLLHDLQEQGIRAYVATSKPQIHAEAICEHFGMRPYITKISGAVLGGLEDKAKIMASVLDALTAEERRQAVMVGDRKFDVIGAKTCGVPCIGVGYGYGNDAERAEFPPRYYARDVKELRNILLGEGDQE